jgi:hemoglobin/transferrin/lactoferrin receptor protein
LTVSVKPYDWLQPFVSYSKSFRPPTVMESFLASGHTSDGINTWAPNPNLLPERGDTWEIGANISKNGLFKPNDTLRLKVVGFYRNVEDYIALGRGYIEETNRIYASPVNLTGTTHIKGIEIEANYDARAWYLGGTFTLNKTDWADTYSLNGVTEVLGPNTPVIFVQPEQRVTIDGGIRLFDQKLTIGGRMTAVGEAKPTIGTLQNNYKLDAYTTYDLYGSYAFSEAAKLRFTVNNLTDVAYVSALGADYYAMPGRTATVGLQIKF